MPNKIAQLYKAGLFIVLIILDQLSKALVLKYSHLASINQDLAFSLRLINPLVLNLLALLVFSFFIYLYDKKFFWRAEVLLIYSGAVSNIIDRLCRLGVVDFIDFKIWPSFNIADSMIFIGSVFLVIALIRKPSN